MNPSKIIALIGGVVATSAVAQTAGPDGIDTPSLPALKGILPSPPTETPAVKPSPDLVIPDLVGPNPIIHPLAQTVPPKTPAQPSLMPTSPTASIVAESQGQNLFLVINNSRSTLMCSSRAPDGKWEPWFEVKSAENWEGSNASKAIYFQCRPPVAQIRYALKPGTRYSLLPLGDEIKLIEVTAGHPSH